MKSASSSRASKMSRDDDDDAASDVPLLLRDFLRPRDADALPAAPVSDLFLRLARLGGMAKNLAPAVWGHEIKRNFQNFAEKTGGGEAAEGDSSP